MKWYEENYVNRRDWILDHLNQLDLDAEETVIVLLIDFMNEHHMPITIENLAFRTKRKEEEVNQTVSLLCARKYLDIQVQAGHVTFHLDGLFDTDLSKEAGILDSSLFDIFESEFGRPLSNQEMQKISDWNRSFDKKTIILALREASAYQKLSVPYIEGILSEWRKKGR